MVQQRFKKLQIVDCRLFTILSGCVQGQNKRN